MKTLSSSPKPPNKKPNPNLPPKTDTQIPSHRYRRSPSNLFHGESKSKIGKLNQRLFIYRLPGGSRWPPRSQSKARALKTTKSWASVLVALVPASPVTPGLTIVFWIGGKASFPLVRRRFKKFNMLNWKRRFKLWGSPWGVSRGVVFLWLLPSLSARLAPLVLFFWLWLKGFANPSPLLVRFNWSSKNSWRFWICRPNEPDIGCRMTIMELMKFTPVSRKTGWNSFLYFARMRNKKTNSHHLLAWLVVFSKIEWFSSPCLLMVCEFRTILRWCTMDSLGHDLVYYEESRNP